MSIEKRTEEEQRAYFDRAHEELNDVLADRMVRHIIETAVLPQVGYMLEASVDAEDFHARALIPLGRGARARP